MKRALLLLAAASLIASCSSANKNKNASLVKPQLALEQLVGPSELGYPAGRIDVQFALHVGNRSAEPLTVRRVEIGTISTGAYVLRRESFVFDKQIPAGSVDAVTFWAHGYARGGGPNGFGATEPVTVRAIVYFNTPAGPFQQVLVKDLGQWDRPRG
ncbi:MAG TPA: hypothetical protein VGR02_02490 [Thermoanaerobaculia bacterium]|jgi:hypothetical protein|nr:hypothetical protein [Thermoanaerobaculia bacterium]